MKENAKLVRKVVTWLALAAILSGILPAIPNVWKIDTAYAQQDLGVYWRPYSCILLNSYGFHLDINLLVESTGGGALSITSEITSADEIDFTQQIIETSFDSSLVEVGSPFTVTADVTSQSGNGTYEFLYTPWALNASRPTAVTYADGCAYEDLPIDDDNLFTAGMLPANNTKLAVDGSPVSANALVSSDVDGKTLSVTKQCGSYDLVTASMVLHRQYSSDIDLSSNGSVSFHSPCPDTDGYELVLYDGANSSDYLSVVGMDGVSGSSYDIRGYALQNSDAIAAKSWSGFAVAIRRKSDGNFIARSSALGTYVPIYVSEQLPAEIVYEPGDAVTSAGGQFGGTFSASMNKTYSLYDDSSAASPSYTFAASDNLTAEMNGKYISYAAHYAISSTSSYRLETNRALLKIDTTPTYKVSLPTSVSINAQTLSGTLTITASDISNLGEEAIAVKLSSAHYSSGYHCLNSGDSSLRYNIYASGSTTPISQNGEAARFTANGSQTLTLELENGPAYAGTYTDTLTFSVALE